MKFSETFGISTDGSEDWFDPVLSIDTKLFVDPFLIYDLGKDEPFLGSHEEIVDFFNYLLILIAKASGDKSNPKWKEAENLALFPEVEEICLGYTSLGTGGLGSGREFSKLIVEGLATEISQGIMDISHFENLQVFQEGIGPDRISDACAGILRHRLAQYTLEICNGLSIPLQKRIYPRGRFDTEKGRWIACEFLLPINPYNKTPIMLVPKKFLRPLPTINPYDFWDYLIDNEPEVIRNRFGSDIGQHINKDMIVDVAINSPESRRRYLETKEGQPGVPYDEHTDRKGLIQWYEKTRNWVDENPHTFSFGDKDSFISFVDEIIREFQNYVENDGGWKLLWNDDKTARSEDACQRVFLGIVKHYCKANNIDITSEANIGRGPVDFKVSSGYNNRCLIELKLARNTKWSNGLTRQLPKYLEAEGVSFGKFVIIAFNDNDIKRVENVQDKASLISESTPYKIGTAVVDARYAPPSASLL